MIEMSALQEQAIEMIHDLSDDNVSFLIEIMQKLIPTKKCLDNTISMQAFHRLDDARKEIKQYLPDDFDSNKELEEALTERYDSID